MKMLSTELYTVDDEAAKAAAVVDREIEDPAADVGKAAIAANTLPQRGKGKKDERESI